MTPLRHPLRWVLGLAVVLSVVAPAPAGAVTPTPMSLTLDAPAAYAGTATTARLRLTADGAPLADQPVTVERRIAGQWSVLDTVTTDDSGLATTRVTLRRDSADNVVRATYPGDASYAATGTGNVPLTLRRRNSVIEVGGPSSVVDERTVSVSVRWTTASGEPVSGPVTLQRRGPTGPWRRAARLSTDGDGRAQLTVRPRTDTRWRASVPRLDWVEPATSAVHRVDNLPPGVPVRLPAAAPHPRVHVPPQPHAVGGGANVVVTAIPTAMWRQMTGISWHQGCPAGRAGLRLVRVNYWDYTGYRRRGEVVTATGAARQISGALAQMYASGLPIRSMYRVDRFGYSRRVNGGNDYASMAAGNTSAFNCRSVVNRPGVRSPHAYGRALDVNTWENPYRSATGLVPNTWWQSHSHPRVAWRSRSHPVVEVLAQHGLRWTYGLDDTQHFDAAYASGRMVARSACGPVACE